jgi:hypothetical protein
MLELRSKRPPQSFTYTNMPDSDNYIYLIGWYSKAKSANFLNSECQQLYT